MTNEFDVVVIGAGLSGLRAALEIHRAGLSFVVLEALDSVGGKLPVGGGGSWINDSSQTEIHALAQLFGLDLVKQYISGTFLYQKKDGNVVPYPLGFGPDVQEPDVLRLYEMLDRLSRAWLGPDAKALDSVTLRALAEANCSDKIVAGDAADFLSRQFLGVDSAAVSALFMIEFIKSSTGLENLLSPTWGGAQYLRVRQGARAFATRLAALLPPGSVRLSSAAKNIVQTADACLVETVEGAAFASKKIIVSVPTTSYRSIAFNPPLPAPAQTLADSTINGYHAHVTLAFSNPWWRQAGLSGSVESAAGPIAFVCDTSCEEDGQYSLTCFLVWQLAQRQWEMQFPGERYLQVMGYIRNVFGTRIDAELIPPPVAIAEGEWPEGTMPVMPPGILASEAGEALGRPFRNIHFIGAEMSKVWRGYMEGAVRSGVAGAHEVITALAV